VRPSARAVKRYLEMREFQNSKDRPYIHLVDGGVADNIGMRGVLEALAAVGASAGFRGEIGFGAIRRIVVIVANSRSAPKTDWDRKEDPPGTIDQLLKASGVPIDRYSFETIELMKDREEIYGWRRDMLVLQARLAGASEAEAEARVPLPKLSLHLMDISFDAIQDPTERERFFNMPTTFVLPAADVDRLREIAGRLLRQSEDYQSLLRDMRGTLPKAGANAN
jgi:NTE family protein